MPEKLLTLEELSSYLGISEKKILSLVADKVIFAYKIGGEFIRFRKEQIDAIYPEILSRVKDSDKIQPQGTREKVKERHRIVTGDVPFKDRVSDFFYFYDFYIVSSALILVLLAVILTG